MVGLSLRRSSVTGDLERLALCSAEEDRRKIPSC